ncbi:MAG TPA: MFS transporter [Bacteroidota bacterium]|nr:MFS transporter [Bacteroidota bacterium]
MRTLQKNLTNGFYALISLPSTAMGFALSIQISALSWILTTQYHLDIHQVGIVWAAGPLAGIFGQVIVGLISDRVWFWGGRRRPFIVVGGILAALMLFALPNIREVAGAVGVANLLVVATAIALTLDLAINISFNPTRSIIADVTPEGTPRTKGYTWMQTISGFFGVTAYVVGAVFGNFALIYAGVFLVLAFSVIPVFFISEPRELAAAGPGVTAPATRTEWGQLWRIFGAHAFSWIGVQTMFVYIIAFIQQKMALPASAEEGARAAGQIISVSFAVLNTVGFILPAPVLEPLAVRFTRVRVHACALAIMALGYFGIVAAGSSVAALYVLMGVLGIGWASVVSLPFAIMTEKIDKSRTGFFMGIFNLSVVLPQLFVSLVLGTVIQHAADTNVIFLISGCSLALSALGWLLVREGRD